ncbi:hypothetical protein REPUB_Repub12eG0037000 [Reevesia pubescens]
MILLDASRGGAIGASPTKFNGSGRFAPIAANMELEFLMDSEIGRRLGSENRYETDGTKDRNNPAADCGRGNSYSSCTPPVNKDHKKPEKCYIYNRECPAPRT